MLSKCKLTSFCFVLLCLVFALVIAAVIAPLPHFAAEVRLRNDRRSSAIASPNGTPGGEAVVGYFLGAEFGRERRGEVRRRRDGSTRGH